MPTTRKKRTRKPAQKTPEWAIKMLKTGEKPSKFDPGHDQWIGWYFFDESVPGIPLYRDFNSHTGAVDRPL